MRRVITILLIAAVAVIIFIPVSSQATGESSLAMNALTSPGGTSIMQFVIRNSDSASHTYSLGVSNLSSEINVYFVTDGAAVTNVAVPAAGYKSLKLQVDIPENPAQSSYDFQILSTRDDGITETIPAQITVNDDYSVIVISEINSFESLNGKSFSLDIAVTNTGNNALTDLGITARLPYKWVLESVTPEKLSLFPAENGVYRITVMIPSSQNSGNMEIGIRAENDQVQSAVLNIPVKVTANANLAIFMLGGIMVTVIITFVYFRRHGRR